MTDIQPALLGKAQIPQFGFGTWNLTRTAHEATLHALKTGYRHIDTADIYNTHDGVGQAVAYSGLPRQDIFITTKLWNNSLTKEKVGPAVDRFLKELNTDYIDLLLIHWPSRSTPYAETLQAMHAVRRSDKIKWVGLSNFHGSQLREALDSGVEVVNNQIEYNLNHMPQDTLDFCTKNDITVSAYSPLERGSRQQERLVAELADKYDASREQILLAWLLSKGTIQIPRSQNPAHIEANWASQRIEFAAEDAARLDHS